MLAFYLGLYLAQRMIDVIYKNVKMTLYVSVCVRLNDRVRIEDLHTRCKIVSLEQRRRNQLLSLMYKKSKDLTLHKVFVRNTRESARIVFKTDTYEGQLYKRSP